MLFRLTEVHKAYSGRDILRGVSFQVNAGEKIGLVGRNGAGKTTIFRLIIGEETPDSGEVATVNNLKLGLLEQHVDFSPTESVHTSALSAFEKIHDIESEIRRLEKEMGIKPSSKTLTRYAQLQEEFELEDGFSCAAKAEAILLGLGFQRETWNWETSKLSGGQKNRLGLAKLLLSDADVLLLDEPTNHLDVEAVEWLENFLKTYQKTHLTISHDRYFLDRTCEKIIEIENGKTYSYKGNYSAFLIERKKRREQQRREFEKQQAFIAKTEEFVRRNIEGQKTKQAKSRRNMLGRLERVEEVVPDKPSGNFSLKKIERAGQSVLTVENLSIGYGQNVLAKDLNFVINRGDCLGVIGGNGTGKTTFLKTILGHIREISGKIVWGTKTDIGYYSQDLADLEPRNEIIQEIRRVAPLAENGELRSFLARFLFSGDDVFKLVKDLSGGEKGRLALAKLIYSNKNVLVLDEPTNHLDIPSREALENALAEYRGTIITVSHDRFFLDKVATQIFSFENNGETEFYEGNYSEFCDWRTRRGNSANGENIKSLNKNGSSEKSEVEYKKTKIERTFSKNKIQEIQRRITEIEQQIPHLEENLSKISFEMNLPEIASDHEKLFKATEKYQLIEQEIQDLYEEWENLESIFNP